MPVLSTITAATAATMDTLRRLLKYARDAEGELRAWLDVLIRDTKAAALQLLRDLQQARAALVCDLKKARVALEPTGTALAMPPTGEQTKEKKDAIKCEYAMTERFCGVYKGTAIYEYVYESAADSATDSATDSQASGDEYEEEEGEEDEYAAEEASECEDEEEVEEEEEEDFYGEGEYAVEKGDEEGQEPQAAEEEEEGQEEEEEEEQEQDPDDAEAAVLAASNAAFVKVLDNAKAKLTGPRQCVLVMPQELTTDEWVMADFAKVTEWLTALGVPFTPKFMTVDVNNKTKDPYFTQYATSASKGSYLPYIFVEDVDGSNSASREFVAHQTVASLVADMAKYTPTRHGRRIEREKYIDAMLTTRAFFLGVAKPNAAEEHADDDV